MAWDGVARVVDYGEKCGKGHEAARVGHDSDGGGRAHAGDGVGEKLEAFLLLVFGAEGIKR